MEGISVQLSDAQKLKVKLKEWTERLDGDDDIGLWNQIGAMLWWSAFYHSINESRIHLQEDQSGIRLANGPLHKLIDEGYLTRQAVAMRRNVNDSQHDTNTLVNLLKDIKKNAGLLTRRNMLEARDLEYDFEPIKREARREGQETSHVAGKRAFTVSGKGWFESQCWHDLWDDVCRTSPDKRAISDTPDKQWFQQLSNDLVKAAREIEEYVNNYIAHAARPERLCHLPLEYKSLSLDKLWRAERAVVRVACFITRCIVRGAEAGNVPQPIFDQFEHLDLAFATAGGLVQMKKAWQEHADQIERCREWKWSQSRMALSRP